MAPPKGKKEPDELLGYKP
jgi:hypothetical protein